ncbi:MAG TPA: glycosyl transferase family 2 [Planctomycetaceae bacterium]|nr:glycosyl transferase family 2 [Planctomycetaceae bacterium]
MRILSVLIPVYNEETLLRSLVEKVLAAPLPEDVEREIILIDDCSTDRTPEVIRYLCDDYPRIKAFRQSKNQGKGAAIRRAIREMSGDFAIFQDADLEYDPDEYSVVLAPLLDGEADAVYGSRFARNRKWSDLLSLYTFANYFLTWLSNRTTGFALTDMETCYKAFRSDLLKSIPLRSDRFGIEPEITAKLSWRGVEVCEVPISYRGRLYSEGKKIGWKDGVSAIWTILKYCWKDDSRRPPLPASGRIAGSEEGKQARVNSVPDSAADSAGAAGRTDKNAAAFRDSPAFSRRGDRHGDRRNGCACRQRRPGRGI